MESYLYNSSQMFLCSIDGFLTEEESHEQDEDSYQGGFFYLPLMSF